jgi:thioredoxin-related protein
MNLISKNKWLLVFPFVVVGFCILSFKPAPVKTTPGVEAINWMDWDKAVALNKAHPKKIFIDVYTQWCGWCKRMDASTYLDTSIINYMNKNFYAVRLDAETQDTFHFNDHKFYVQNPTQKGAVNELAYTLLNGQMSYPTTVYMDESFNRLTIFPGYHSASELKPVLAFFAENKYKTETYDAYVKSLSAAKTAN